MSKSALSTKPVPQHLLERHENEWRQMQNSQPAPSPTAPPARS